jgi:hypothetical protein
MRRSRPSINDLRLAIDCMPVRTRIAMLEGVRSNDIIVGAYTDRKGGVCPMLAAHRCGGRTDFLSFAHAWDRFTRANNRARLATEREVRILESHLEASLLADDQIDLAAAIADHRASTRHDPDRPRPGDPDRSTELRKRAGWAWLRPLRRLDDYERALARAEEQRSELEAAELFHRDEHEHNLIGQG